MTNSNEIEIKLIKNLDLIYFYNVGDNNHIGLNIVYDNGKNLNYNYEYKYFADFVAKVVSVYKNEKDKRNIQFLDEESKRIIDSFCHKEIKTNDDKKIITQERNLKFCSRFYDVYFLKDYLIRVLECLTNCFSKYDVVLNKSFCRNGNDRFRIYLDCISSEVPFVGDRFNYVFPLIVVKSDEKKYRFKINFALNSQIIKYVLEGEFNIYSDCVSLSFSDYNNNLTGNFIYHSDITKSEEIIKHNNNIVFYNNEFNNKINDLQIDSYLDCLDLPLLKNRVKTVNDCYLLVDEIDNIKYFIHMSFLDGFQNIKYEKCIGVKKDNIFIPLEKEGQNINIIKNSEGLVVEKHFLKTDVSTCEYKTNYEDKYTYDYYNGYEELWGKVKVK